MFRPTCLSRDCHGDPSQGATAVKPSADLFDSVAVGGHPVTAPVDLYHPSKNDTTDSDQGSLRFFLSAAMGEREPNACEHCDGCDKSQVSKTTLIYEPAFQLSCRKSEKNKAKDLLFVFLYLCTRVFLHNGY